MILSFGDVQGMDRRNKDTEESIRNIHWQGRAPWHDLGKNGSGWYSWRYQEGRNELQEIKKKESSRKNEETGGANFKM